ncbi:hypothetical protein [Sinosporangium siamense]|uniref:Restriction endonuclease subunit S n=1 Tax=Sinosporangium siamense TaxID=1367973 RepID=A0A919RNV9_9ACTN|nr:hypothetical protein [Sinosporangium siamense]GII96305.1 hypothetical protein Ssi02_65360 [Sinosporangium siamense]
MSDDIAIEALVNRTPPSWGALPFRRLAILVDSANKGGNATLLSLSSKGVLAPREEFDGLGRQAPSNDTVERYWLVEPGDLVVNPMWLVGGGIGVSETAGAVSPDYRVYSLGPDLYPRYIHHLLRSQPYRDQYKLYTRADTTFDRRVSKIDFHAMPILVPPFDEQRRIANLLDAETARIDQLMRQRHQQLLLLEEKYAAAISEILVPGGASNNPNPLWPWLPISIRTVRLGYIARVRSGVTVHSARERTSEDAEYPYLRVANVQGERVDLSEVKKITIPASMALKSMLRPGDVVMTEANGNPDNLGRGAVWSGEIPEMVHQNHIFAIRADRNKVVPEYISALLASAHGRGYFRLTSTQVGIATTSSSKVLDFPVPIMSLEEQHSAVRRCQQARRSTSGASDALARQLALLSERREAFITAAVTGQIDVTTVRGVDTSGLSPIVSA